MRYLVSWHVEVEAEDPVDAALAVAARPRYLRNAAFTVLDQSSGQTFEVDLQDEEKGETASLMAPEPSPRSVEGPAAWDLVIADMRERDAIGAAKYGQRLTVGDGRRSLVDAYQEILDLAVYIRKEIAERAEEKALLDWYEANPNSVIFSSGYRGEKGSWSYRDSGKFSTDALTLRDAIRAARNAARPQ